MSPAYIAGRSASEDLWMHVWRPSGTTCHGPIGVDERMHNPRIRKTRINGSAPGSLLGTALDTWG